MARICIVTPDTVGPVTNGGIGTHCYTLALYCAQQGHEVTLLFTGTCPCATKDRSRALYAAKNVTLLFLDDFPPLAFALQLPEQFCTAARVLYSLRDTSYDQIHFQDWQANGFYCIQAKRVLGYFAKTLLAVTTHSSTEWIQEGMQQWSTGQLASTKLMWAERYCVEHCDYHISPSRAMLQWLKANDWVLPAQSCCIPYLFFTAETASYAPNMGVFAFFGRLETRKGLEIFCEGLLRLPEKLRTALQKILFVGKEGTCAGQPAVDYIKTQLASLGDRLEIHCDLDTFSAQQLLRQQGAVIFLPSLMDNLPFCGLECAVGKMPALAANVGGFPEIFAPEQLFAPNPQGVAAAMEFCLTRPWAQPEPLYNPQSAMQGWKELLQQRSVINSSCPRQPLVSICMPYYNHGKYLQAALDSLCAQNYPYFEVFVMDDGSTDPVSKELFCALTKRMDSRFHFIRKENEGPAITRNTCVEVYAKGEYIVFCDADNIFEPHMLSTYVAAMEYSAIDILTCHFYIFSSSSPPKNDAIASCCAPVGADLTSAMLENVLGDTNCILKKTVFTALGGFTESRLGCEDWDFLTAAVLAGKKLDVVPLPLFHYRITTTGINSTTSHSANHRRVLENFKGRIPSYAYRAVRDLLAPARAHTGIMGYENSVIVTAFVRWGIGLENMYVQLCPAGSILQRFATRLWHTISAIFSSRRT